MTAKSAAERWDSIDRYVVISSDTHGGADTATYRDYLERRWHGEFDDWLSGLDSPFAGLSDPEYGRLNWDSDLRLARSDEQGVAAEVIFPNTLPPFYDTLCHLSGVPREADELERRWAGLRAHNRWLVDFCGEAPARRRGVVQLLPNDVEAAVAEVHWAADTDMVAGVMLPAVPANHPVAPYFHSRYDPLWAACAQRSLPVHQHQGTGAPETVAGAPASVPVFFIELDLWTRRTMTHLICGGVFERHPELKVVWTEFWGIGWVLEELARMEKGLRVVQRRYAGQPDVLNFSSVFGSEVTDSLSLSPREYFARNCYLGASLLPRHEVGHMPAVGVDRLMWGNDFPHPEGAAPFTREALRATLYDVAVGDCRQLLGGVAAGLYGFDLESLVEVAQRIGPPVEEVHRPLTDIPRSTAEAFAGPP